MSIFEIDPDIRRAKTITSDFYTDPAYFELAKERIFARTWQVLGLAQVAATLWPATILPGLLDEPVLIINGPERPSCFSNVCTHRGKILVERPFDAGLIRCGYHGRRFSLEGKCISMPEFEGVEGFPSECDNLRPLPLAEWAGFMFASIDPAGPFELFVDNAAVRLKDLGTHELRLFATREYEVTAHWALYCENYLEGLHIPFVHHGLNAVVDYGTYTTDTFRYSSLQTGYDEAGDVAAQYLFIFPNMMFNFYPWGISVNVVRPVSHSKSKVEFLSYVWEESLMASGAGADLHSVEMEDEAVVESVQKGIRSRYYTHGRYSPTREQGTHHFHRLIAEFMK
jgi:choline monooxygenase